MLEHVDIKGWSEPAATNAPVEDEVVEAVLGMNQKHILPAQSFFFFPLLLCPKNFLSYLPTSPLLPLPSYLPPTSYLPPPYLLPTSPLLPPTYLPLPELGSRLERSRSPSPEPGCHLEREWSRSPSPEPGAIWSESRAGANAGP
jgi:hypothetical protein